jgi:5,10-methylene-tetrahydrofolate dehydrogenase/methenyl tetrahydrofolate cyclohydrolase
MADNILEIKKLIEKYDKPVFEKQLSFYKENGIKPSLTAILTNNDSGSKSYMRGIEKFCNCFGINFRSETTANGKELEQLILDLNNSETDGIMVMYPTGYDKKDTYYMNLVDVSKDVEGLHYSHLGYLVQFEKFRDASKLRKLVIPPTPKGILYIFKKHYTYFEEFKEENGHYPDNSEKNPFLIAGKKITVINDSLAVGRSLALMMLNELGSVQVCHKFTPYEDLLRLVKVSDFIISAVPSSSFVIPTEVVPDNAIVVDISFEGNFEYPSITEKVKKIAPRWDLTEKGNRINDMTLYRLISNLFYLINSKLPDSLLNKLI